MARRAQPGASDRARSSEPDAISGGGPIRIPGRGTASAHDPVAYVAAAGLLVAIGAAAAELLAGPGSRIGWWPFRTGFEILRWAAYGGIAAVVVSLVAGVAARPGSGHGGASVAVAGLLLGLAAAGVPYGYQRMATTVPAIHDITTDTENPPAFAALLPLRREAPNGAEYGGPEVAAKQRAAYPDVRPAHLSAPPDAAFDRALAAARSMGWEIAGVGRADGRIEATATTFWFGFKDDIVVRVAPEGSGSRIDVRSVSRVGKSDLGTNARRVRKYLATLRSVG